MRRCPVLSVLRADHVGPTADRHLTPFCRDADIYRFEIDVGPDVDMFFFLVGKYTPSVVSVYSTTFSKA